MAVTGRLATERCSCADRMHRGQLGHLDTGQRALAWLARELELVGCAVNDAEPFPHVGESYSARHRLIQRLGEEPHPVVFDLDDRAAVLAMAADRDDAGPDLAREAVLDRVLHQRLED